MDAWVTDPKRTIQATVFDSSDGVRSHASLAGLYPACCQNCGWKIVVPAFDGVSVIDPRHLPFNKLPPPVHIEQVTADRKTYWQNYPAMRPPRSRGCRRWCAISRLITRR